MLKYLYIFYVKYFLYLLVVTLVFSFLLHRCKETVSWIDCQQDSKEKNSISIKMHQYLYSTSQLNTTLCDIFCQQIAAGYWFPPGILVSSTNKPHQHGVTEILLKVALSTITLILLHCNVIKMRCLLQCFDSICFC